MTPYYQDALVTIWHGDARELAPDVAGDCAVMVTDPPFGIAYESGHEGVLPRSIEGDETTAVRDAVLAWWSPRPALVFGSWKAPRPEAVRMKLVWDTGGALGMGALDLPWKPAHQEVYVLGRGFTGKRGSDVLAFPPVQSMAANGRVHPHEKPSRLLKDLIRKCPPGGVLDPFMGSGSTLRAAKDLGRRSVGIEIDERYCEVAAKRMAQEVLFSDASTGSAA